MLNHVPSDKRKSILGIFVFAFELVPLKASFLYFIITWLLYPFHNSLGVSFIQSLGITTFSNFDKINDWFSQDVVTSWSLYKTKDIISGTNSLQTCCRVVGCGAKQSFFGHLLTLTKKSVFYCRQGVKSSEKNNIYILYETMEVHTYIARILICDGFQDILRICLINYLHIPMYLLCIRNIGIHVQKVPYIYV